MGAFRSLLAGSVVVGIAASAPALELELRAEGTPLVGGQITYTVAFVPTTNVTGYDLTIAWDPLELGFASATALYGGFFVVSPDADEALGTRVASLLPVPDGVAAGELFSVSFDVLDEFADDGAFDDFLVFVDPQVNGAGVAGPIGVPVSIDNPEGHSADGLSVPEPDAGSGWLALSVLAWLASGARRGAGAAQRAAGASGGRRSSGTSGASTRKISRIAR